MPLVFDIIDLENIKNARLEPGKVWYNANLDYLRTKIKNYYRGNPFEGCCYCGRLFIGEFALVIDVEHILPQVPFDDLIFHPINLNIACKRCNMNIKKARLDFIVDIALMGTDYFNPAHYKFIHPNLDIYEDHLLIRTYRQGNINLNKYIIKSTSKGQYTYDYFALKEFEVNSLYESQGIKPLEKLSSKFKGYLRTRLLDLVNKL